MSLYQLQRCLFDRVTGSEPARGGYDLSPDELDALTRDDIGRLYGMGVHPVLVNAYARYLGLMRENYREQLQPYALPNARRARWQSS